MYKNKKTKTHKMISNWKELAIIHKIQGYGINLKLNKKVTEPNSLIAKSIENLEDLACFIVNKNIGLGVEKYNKKKELLVSVIKNNPKLIIENVDELIKLIKNLNIKNSEDKKDIVKAMIKINPLIVKDINSTKEMINFFTKDRDQDIDFIITNIVQDRNLINDVQDFFTIIDDFQISSYEHNKENIKKIILNNINILESSNLIPILLNCIIINKEDSQDLIKEIILKKPSIIENTANLLTLIKEIEIENEVAKQDFAIFAINKNPQIITSLNNQKEDIEENLINLIKSIKIEYRVDIICDLINRLDLIQEVFSDKNQQNVNLIKIVNTLYNNDFYKTELLKQAINENLINQSNFLESDFDKLEEEKFFNIVLYAKDRNLINNIQLLNHFGQKSFGRYQSIRETLKNKTVEDILVEDGIYNIAEEFYSDENYQDNDIFNLIYKPAISLITYYDIFNKTEILATTIKEEVKQELKQKFYPAGFEILNQEQINKIANLIAKDSKELRSQYVNIGKLSTIFTQYFNKIPNFKQSIENIEDNELMEKLTLTGDKFHNLLLSIFPDQKEIIDNNIEKINNSVNDNKNNFFYILSQKDGKEIIKNIIMGVEDGCKANIANQINNQALKIAIDNSDIEDEKHKYSLIKTYNIFMERIIIPIINKGGDKLGGSGSANFLQDKQEQLNDSYISLSALYKYGEQNNSYQIEIIGNNLINKTSESNYYDKIGEISSFVALKSVLGEDNFSKILKNYQRLDKSKIINKIDSRIINLDGDDNEFIEPENDNFPKNQITPKNHITNSKRLNNKRIFD